MRPNKRKVQFWRRIQRTQTRNSTVGLPGAPLKLSPPLLLNTLDDVLKHVSLAARTAVAVPSSIERSQLRPPSLIAGDTTATYPLDQQLQALGDERLKAAHEAAMAGLTAEKLLAHIKPIGNFHFVVGLTMVMTARRGLLNINPT